MKKLLALFVGLIMLAGASAGIEGATAKTKPAPEVEILVDISNQTMTVDVNGWTYGRWKVSTARDGYYTPRGSWRPFMLKKMHYSRKYDNSPMPHSIFFRGGYAIHGTYATGALGRPVSHGCVRLSPGHAAQLYRMVRREGARISIGGR